MKEIVPANRIGNVQEYYFSVKLKEIAQMNAQGADVINLGIGSPDLPPAQEVTDTLAAEAVNPKGHGYQPYVGIPQLREAFAQWYERWYGVQLNPANEVLPLMGSKEGQIALSTFVNIAPYLIVALGVVLGMLNIAYLTVVLVMPVSLWLVGSLRDFVNHKDTPLEPKRWMGPMGDFERFRQAGLDWFMLRWLTARNIVTRYCFIIIVVNFIFG